MTFQLIEGRILISQRNFMTLSSFDVSPFRNPNMENSKITQTLSERNLRRVSKVDISRSPKLKKIFGRSRISKEELSDLKQKLDVSEATLTPRPLSPASQAMNLEPAEKETFEESKEDVTPAKEKETFALFSMLAGEKTH